MEWGTPLEIAVKTNHINYNPSSEIELYTNPVSNILNIRSSFDVAHTMVIIFDQIGRVNMQFSMWDKVNRIDVSHLKPGLYIVKILAGNRTIRLNSYDSNTQEGLK